MVEENEDIDGYIDDMFQIIDDTNNLKKIRKSDFSFGFNTSAFLINKSKVDLLYKINKIILDLHDTDFIYNTCEMYMEDSKLLCRL